MYNDIAIIRELLQRISDATELIQSKISSVQTADDFLQSPDGMFLLSGICMQLIFIGESVKNLDKKTGKEYLDKYPEIPWKDIMGLRDIIVHEYHRIDEDEIFLIIHRDLPPLKQAVLQMLSLLPLS